MDALLAQISALLSQKFVVWLVALYVAAQLWWWLRVYIAQKYRPSTKKYKGSYSVVVVVRRPTPTQLTTCLKSISTHGRPNELIVAIHDAPHAPKRLKTIVHNYATKVIEHPYPASTRELYSVASNALRKHADIIIALTPKATWDATTLEVLKPFANKLIGAVVPREYILGSSWAARMHQWASSLQARVLLPLQGRYAQVHSPSTHLIAIRRDLFAQACTALRNELFLGRRVLTADYMSFTTYLLAQGHGIAYQATASLQVAAPSAVPKLFASYTAQYRSVLRSLRHGALLRRLHPIVTLTAVTALFSPVLYISLLAVIIFMLVYGVYAFGATVTLPAVGAVAAIALLVYTLGLYVRHLPLRSNPHYVVAPLLAVTQGLLQLVSKTLALFSLAENGKHARTLTTYGEGKVGRSRVAVIIAAVALFIVTLPLVYSTLVTPQGVPFTTILEGRGQTYATAQNFAARLRDTTTTNDPSPQELTSFIRDNGSDYNQIVNDTTASQSHDCVQRVLLNEPIPATILDGTQACYANALAAQQQKQSAPTPPRNPVIVVRAAKGDTLTHLVRAQTKRLDTAGTLSAAQAVFIETTYLRQTGQQHRKLAVNEVVNINTNDIATLVTHAAELTPQQLSAWNRYTHNVTW